MDFSCSSQYWEIWMDSICPLSPSVACACAQLVLANKQDLPGACNAAEISEEMHLYPPYISKSCYIQSCCATSGEGLHEGLDWLSSNIPETNNEKDGKK